MPQNLKGGSTRCAYAKSLNWRSPAERWSARPFFDTGSGYTITRRTFFEKSFGPSWERLSNPVKLHLVNGEFVEADKYARVTLIIDGVELLPPETVLVLDEFVEEVEVDGRRIKTPEVIVGAGTMDKYGILLDPREGVKVLGAGLLL